MTYNNYRIDYYQQLDGREPAREWIKAQDKTIRVSIYGKFDDLRKKGTVLIGTNSLLPLRGHHGLFELRNVGFNWRIGVYYDSKSLAFVLLWGWHHKKGYEVEIEKTRRYLLEYLKMEHPHYG